MVIHDTDCPFPDQVPLNNTELKLKLNIETQFAAIIRLLSVCVHKRTFICQCSKITDGLSCRHSIFTVDKQDYIRG